MKKEKRERGKVLSKWSQTPGGVCFLTLTFFPFLSSFSTMKEEEKKRF